MATIGKKRRKTTSGKRKTGATKAKSRRKVAGTPATVTIAGSKFTKTACSRLKTDAKKAADRARAGGKNARVIKSGTGYCVYTRGRKKAA